MRYLTFGPEEKSSYDVCFLVPQLNEAEIRRLYIDPHLMGTEADVLAYSLLKHPKSTPVAIQRDYLRELLPVLKSLRTTYLVVADAEYFKTLTGAPKPEAALGAVLPSVGWSKADPADVAVFEGFQVIYCPNFRAVFYNPDKVNAEIARAMHALRTHRRGSYIEPGQGVLRQADYPSSIQQIHGALQRLLDEGRDLAADIEGFGLKHWETGIGTIAFAWSKHEGLAFPVDCHPDPSLAPQIRELLRAFFEEWHRRAKVDGRKLVWHNISFDAYVLVYQLWMKDLLDTEGLLQGLEIMLGGRGPDGRLAWDDTKLITYLATNTCAGNKLGLKGQALEFAGNYAVEDIKDIRKIPLPELLEYNLIDCLGTWFVHEKHRDTMIRDQQEEIYETLFKPAVLDIIQMQLTGLPIDREEVLKLQVTLQAEADKAMARIQANPHVQRFVGAKNRAWVEKKNATLKRKRVSLLDAKETFNPNSDPQMRELLYGESHLALPEFDFTDSGLPATGIKTLKKLINHLPRGEEGNDARDLIQALLDHGAVDKILTSFIPAFLAAPQGPDGWHYLFGNFNLGGTVSGRLSSSKINLQNLPAGGKPWGKEVKRCFRAPPGWLLVGLDFASLEDRISALTTKDPNKLKVYTDGYDGHSLRAYSYFGDEMPDIDPTSVESINSIGDLYEALRKDSKVPTFLLTYGGTYIGIMQQLGWGENRAKSVEAAYHELYKVSDQWVETKIQEATQTGYVTAAFGLRVRTPLLKQVILGTRRTPHEAKAEGRTAGNALGQSWGLLNSRAGSEFMGIVRSGEHRTNVRPCAQIHDAQYFLIRDQISTLLYVNEHLVRACQWQDHPEIWHPEVKLGGELSVFWPTWAEEMVLPNGATQDQIEALAEAHHAKYSA